MTPPLSAILNTPLYGLQVRATSRGKQSVVDALSPSIVDVVGRQPARRVLETALGVAEARTAVPAIDADVRRPIT